MEIRQAMAAPIAKAGTLPIVQSFIDSAISSGFVTDEMSKARGIAWITVSASTRTRGDLGDGAAS
jgi:hypothetical protein